MPTSSASRSAPRWRNEAGEQGRVGGVTDHQAADAEVLAASVQDPERFGVLVRRWSGPLLRYFHRRTFDTETSLDLVAETLAIAFERRARYRKTDAPASAWLFGIARRELGRYRRRHSVRLRAVRRLGLEVPRLDDVSLERIDELVDAESFRTALRDALEQLSDKQREAIRLRVLDDRPYPAVAAALGCSEGAARVRVHRGLTRLAHILEVPA